MNTRQLSYIKKVYETGGISSAAAELRISQPSLSQMIKNVEKSLDISLFNRDTLPICLTQEGEKYLEAANQILAIEENLYQELQELKDCTRGRMGVGISMHRSISFLPEILYLFKKEYPNVDIQVMELGSHGLESAAYDKKVDIAFATTGQTNPEMAYYDIRVEKIYLVAGKNTKLAQSLPSGSAINIGQAKGEEFVNVRQGHAIRAIQDQLFRENNIDPKSYFETDSIEVARRIALYCDKVALYPKILGTPLVPEARDGSYYEIQRPNDYKTFCLTHRKDLKLKPYMIRFIEIAQEYLRKID